LQINVPEEISKRTCFNNHTRKTIQLHVSQSTAEQVTGYICRHNDILGEGHNSQEHPVVFRGGSENIPNSLILRLYESGSSCMFKGI
jgi:hypothetical protein